MHNIVFEHLLELNSNEDISRQIVEGLFDKAATYFIIPSSVFLLLAAIAAAYFLSKKVYAPIAQIAQKLDIDSDKASFAAIEKSIDSIIDENKKLAQLLSDYYSHHIGTHNDIAPYSNMTGSEGNSIEFPLLAEQNLPSENGTNNNRNQPILETIKKYICENLHEDLSIDTLSEKFYVSSSYLRKLFKDAYSITLKNYIDNERIRRAKELLRDPNIKISDIPQKIGYLSPQSFTRAFKQHTGKTPGEYRNENIQK